MLYLVDVGDFEYVIMAGSPGSAAMRADAEWQGDERQNEGIEEAKSIEAYEQELLSEYNVKEIDRALTIQYVEWVLDGNRNISILL